ncbi:MAG: CHAD domain-containing protein [Synergistaceae bacterium]|jgi:CHAD domain-containing protein|nr:CHAD domain-containing protein [Synergistaceae bacterium]
MTAQPDISAYAISAILEKTDILIREMPGATVIGDPEGVHRTRVASRRLEMAVRLFGGRTGMANGREYLKLIRSTVKVLGAARDLDVHIMWLDGFSASCLPRERPGVKRLALRLSQRREKLQEGIDRSMADFTECSAFRNAVQYLRSARIDIETAGDTRPDSLNDVEYAARVMSMQIDYIVQLSASLKSPDAHDSHHKMRIEMKRLRYAMEMTNGLFGGALDAYISLARKVQDMLGELHDAHVWVENIPGLCAKEKRRTARYFGTPSSFGRLAPGYEAIALDRAKFRHEQQEKVAAFWSETEAAGKWTGLKDLLIEEYRNEGRA